MLFERSPWRYFTRWVLTKEYYTKCTEEGFNINCTITQRTRTSFKILASPLPGGFYVVSHQIG
ncbi:hypothetical protein K443DRAFT_166799 [Laccaria amethystina LaAM-08-1]|uniref:Uncharacterized protein n=1 Tax=Laccaria amethystina LaAM-08-1 TaxID=1095629 RepID=A0A0C9YHW1_9AGAR|nr:hypothetical protein K443DRAFT_166799 [Laccaria amethystina LaAM-08-1]